MHTQTPLGWLERLPSIPQLLLGRPSDCVGSQAPTEKCSVPTLLSDVGHSHNVALSATNHVNVHA